jgi:DNA-binding response OmpR family regulator
MARILVVDDDPSINEIVRYIATKAGYEVVEAANGREGLEQAQSSHPDLIILDVMMPELDGYTLHNKLLSDEATKRIPIIILTAKGQMRDSFVGSANVKFYMDKPFEPKDLQDKIRIALQGLR